ncbi:truncated transposase [Escherichia coli]|uniref:Truncated transposase n=1 Tax=Escherichia coli TaxID=562 RepID=A0A376NRC7_ECOLX|nr:truncated transposase [Escherichia coli]
MGNKNDVLDARAIWMAVQQPGKEIAVKTEEQQSVLVLHRTRRQLVKFRTAQINSLHGTLLEFCVKAFTKAGQRWSGSSLKHWSG